MTSKETRNTLFCSSLQMHTVERWTALKAGCQRTLGRWRPWPRPFLVTPLLVRSVETSQRAEQVGCSRHYCAPRFLTDGNQGRRIAVQNVCQRPIQRENDLRWKSKALQKNKQKKKSKVLRKLMIYKSLLWNKVILQISGSFLLPQSSHPQSNSNLRIQSAWWLS